MNIIGFDEREDQEEKKLEEGLAEATETEEEDGEEEEESCSWLEILTKAIANFNASPDEVKQELLYTAFLNGIAEDGDVPLMMCMSEDENGTATIGYMYLSRSDLPEEEKLDFYGIATEHPEKYGLLKKIKLRKLIAEVAESDCVSGIVIDPYGEYYVIPRMICEALNRMLTMAFCAGYEAKEAETGEEEEVIANTMQ